MERKENHYQDITYFVAILLKIREHVPCNPAELQFFLEYMEKILMEHQQGIHRLEKQNQQLDVMSHLFLRADQEFKNLYHGQLVQLEIEKKSFEVFKQLLLKAKESLDVQDVVQVYEYFNLICNYRRCFIKYYDQGAGFLKSVVLKKVRVENPSKLQELQSYREKLLTYENELDEDYGKKL